MKKITGFLGVILLLFCTVGCGTKRQAFLFPVQGVRVFLRADASFQIAVNEQEAASALMFSDRETDFLGVISVSFADTEQDAEVLCAQYFGEAGEKKTTCISDKLVFAEIDSEYPATGEPNNWYVFLYYDREIPAVLYGRFPAAGNDRERILTLAKSIGLEETVRVSPYPEDYTQIRPEITLLHSGEKVTDYCTVPQTWKGSQYDYPSYTELLKGKKTYVLEEEDAVLFTDTDHKATAFRATASFDNEPLFYEGARGFRIVKPAETDTGEFYILITAEYGSSGELLFAFCCRFF